MVNPAFKRFFKVRIIKKKGQYVEINVTLKQKKFVRDS